MTSPDESNTRLYLLGRFALEVGGRPVPASAWRKRRPVDVLVALALARGRSLHREELIDRFWPDKHIEAGANNVHRALHDLRRISGTELVILERGVARLSDDLWVDVEAFEQAARGSTAELLERAVELYRGELLPDDPYSEALVARRAALRQCFIDGALRLAQMHRAARRADHSLGVLRQLLGVQPALEPAHRLLMQLLAEQGRVADALAQFAACTRALREQLDVAPARATLELKSAIERGEIAATRQAEAPEAGRSELRPAPADRGLEVAHRLLGTGGAHSLHGRSAALGALARFAALAQGVLLILGEAGLGKTRLAAELISCVAGEGANVLLGRALDRDAGVPYAAFADAWSDYRRRAQLPPAADPFLAFVPEAASAQEDRLRLFQSVERALERLSESAPVCLVIEDLHESDQSSLHLFHHLARRAASLPLILVGTLREEEVRVGNPLHTLLASLERERLAQRIVLERLDLGDTAALVAELGGGSDPKAARAVYELSEGNPFYTEQVVRAMREAQSSLPGLPANLLETVRLRVQRLGRDAERLLSAAAIVGQNFAFEVARRASGLGEEPALDALELGLAARIIREDAAEYRFQHALTRQALLEGLTHARLVHLHRGVAEAIEGLGEAARQTHAEALALHHEHAGQLERALPYLLLAAERAEQRLGFSEAVGFLQRAVEWMDAVGLGSAAERFAALRKMGGMRLALSDLNGSVRDLDAAAALVGSGFVPQASALAQLWRMAALALIQAGRLAEAEDRLERALSTLGAGGDDSELPAVLYRFAQLRWHEERHAEARALAERCLAEAERLGDRAGMARGHEMIALACHSLGDWQCGQGHERARQELAAGSLDVDQAFDVHLCLWEYHLYGQLGPDGIRRSVERTLEQAQRMQAPRALALCKSFSGVLDFCAGRWTEAEQQLREAVDLFRQVGSASGEALSLQRLGVLLTARGDFENGLQMLDEGIVVGGRAAMRSHCLTRLHASLARNRLAAGDQQAALVGIGEGLSEAARHGHCASCNALLLPEAVRVELAFEDWAAAERHAAELESVAQRFASRAWTAMARFARGRVLGARGERGAAVVALGEAWRAFEELGQPYEAARARLAASRIPSTTAEQRQQSQALESEARHVLAALGATDREA